MPFGKVMFNKKGHFHWIDSESDISLFIGDDLNKEEWFVGDMYYPPDFEYDTSMHDHQITAWLSKPDELVRYKK